MTDNGDDIPGRDQPSKLAELADWTISPPSPPQAEAPTPDAGQAPSASAPPVTSTSRVQTADDAPAAARRGFARLLGEFRRTAVLVPLDAYGSLWTADQGGVRWICAFSDEEALARFAQVQGNTRREWKYRTILGARLLDVMVPMLAGPGGVALDAGSDDGMLFPPVEGIVPDAAAVDLGDSGGT
ncbi:SseB family protein [Streptomyces sp. NBC_01619]|uniref:SseB family protein n=1 Tax=unclassified Streptomyces TaxID=2593676 RepID=UPI0022592654|nr:MULTISPECIES: SseB family protein [unclassified Streptomyces]MCX4511491.1 SseB family protein [Streptomyces sp. NBC_01619]